jgi:hypothetical protein
MLSADKAEELGCKQNDLRCLCANKNFLYGLRDCSAAICPAEDARKVVDYGISICAGESSLLNYALKLSLTYLQELVLRSKQVLEVAMVVLVTLEVLLEVPLAVLLTASRRLPLLLLPTLPL